MALSHSFADKPEEAEDEHEAAGVGGGGLVLCWRGASTARGWCRTRCTAARAFTRMLYTLPPLVLILVRVTARSLPSRTEMGYHRRDDDISSPMVGLLLVPVLAMTICAFWAQCSGRSRMALEPRPTALPSSITGALWGAGNLCSLHFTKFLGIAIGFPSVRPAPPFCYGPAHTICHSRANPKHPLYR